MLSDALLVEQVHEVVLEIEQLALHLSVCGAAINIFVADLLLAFVVFGVRS